MMTEHEKGHEPELVASFPVDPIRAAFAAAMKVLMEALPPGHTRDIALAEIIAAHERVEHALRLRRVLN